MTTIKILVTNQKGGVGKSTIAANLAAFLAIQNSTSVSLIDFDKQSSSAKWIEKAPNVGIDFFNPSLDYQQVGSVVLAEAKRSLNKYSHNHDISVSDLTWTYAISPDFLLEFDLIVVPSVISKFDIASSEIFVLEYMGKYLEKIKELQQLLLVVPSKVDKSFNPNQYFLNLSSVANCSITPPIQFVPAIDNFVYEDFLCVSTNEAVSSSFFTFGQYVAELVSHKIKQKQNLANLNEHLIKKTSNLSILDKFRIDRSKSKEKNQTIKDEIPQFLRSS